MSNRRKLALAPLALALVVVLAGCDLLTGTPGTDGVDGIDGTDGLSIVWKGSLAAAPATPTVNWAYYDTVAGESRIWDGAAWQVLAKDGAAGAAGADGTNGVTVVYLAPGSDIGLMGLSNTNPLASGAVASIGSDYSGGGFFGTALPPSTSHTVTGISLVNKGSLQLSFSGTPKILAIGGSFMDSGASYGSADSVPEIVVDPIAAATLDAAGVQLGFTVTNLTGRQGTFKKRYRIELQDATGSLYNYEFEAEAVISC